jgi:intracellular sulfur oxidation DsrE/DsrF family protein
MMHRLRYSLLALVLFGLAILPGHAQTKSHRVLFALTSPDQMDWEMTIHNIHNLMKGLAPDNVEVEVVAYGPGISFLKKDSTAAADIAKLEEEHVHFMACGNAMRAMHLTQADLVPGAVVVPAGIVEVVTKEEEGWTYIKAGR